MASRKTPENKADNAAENKSGLQVNPDSVTLSDDDEARFAELNRAGYRVPKRWAERAAAQEAQDKAVAAAMAGSNDGTTEHQP